MATPLTRAATAMPETTRPPAEPADAVAISGLTVRFDQSDGSTTEILGNLDLTIPRGQFLALVGRSGSGKTTILNSIAGLVPVASGTVEVLGIAPAQARSRFGFMPARDALLPWRTALRNVEYGLELRGMRRRERKGVARRYLDMVGLSDAAGRWPWQLSQGMRQRVALARAWALEPELLLLDEPFAALDAQTRETVREQFRSLLATAPGRTVLLVTHDLEEAVTLADRVVVLDGGRITGDLEAPAGAAHDTDGLLTNTESLGLLRKLRSLLRN
ncbi:ABC transporter ATP-binding protein [Amycolatopsis jejuensis]|uniref:ABC transporter ATP-binding protein n=1 Tax=Amycolatopsis jejuensis TaxID=330084 RepID=UPI00068BEC38|nr:ATP-binding cassette domain-containing protein [Amycolatopsis jejuensis]